jgi:hypothetical protein
MIERSADVLSALVGEEIVLIHVEAGLYFGLEKTARSIWELLELPRSIENLCEALADRYRSDAGTLRAETERFVQEMANEGIVFLR